jgi:hypothetical protein
MARRGAEAAEQMLARNGRAIVNRAIASFCRNLLAFIRFPLFSLSLTRLTEWELCSKNYDFLKSGFIHKVVDLLPHSIVPTLLTGKSRLVFLLKPSEEQQNMLSPHKTFAINLLFLPASASTVHQLLFLLPLAPSSRLVSIPATSCESFYWISTNFPKLKRLQPPLPKPIFSHYSGKDEEENSLASFVSLASPRLFLFLVSYVEQGDIYPMIESHRTAKHLTRSLTE